MVISLTKDEREFCAQAGDLRVEANKNKRDIADYRPVAFNLTNKQSNRLAVMVEAAVFKWSGGNILDHDLREWAHYVPPELYREYLKRPDLWGIIEVRRANKPDSPLPMRKKDLIPGGIVVQGYVPYTQEERFGPIKVGLEVDLLGWASESDWSLGQKPWWGNGDNSRVVPKRPMESLRWSKGVAA